MKKLLAFMFGIVLLGMAAAPLTHADEENVEHYAAEKIQTKEDAFKAFEQHNAEISEILKSEKLDPAQHEKIHEISYTYEAAIDKLIAEKAGAPTKLETIDEAVQAVHHASENHEEEKVREWFAKLEGALQTLDTEPAEKAMSEKGVYEIIIKDHTFTPDEIRVPAGEKFKLVVHNQDPTPEEFESDDFRREKIIAGNSKATIHVGPLEPGKYHFFGEFNLDKANGYLIAE